MTTKSLTWLVGGVFALLAAAGVASIALSQAHAATLQPISTSLDIGSSGADVTTLQTLLASSHTLYPAALVTGYYGPLTATAVRQFQIAYDIPAVGRVGPLTRNELNLLIENGTTVLDVDSPFISNIQVVPMSTSATITWQTNELAVGKVHYDSAPIVMFENSAPKTEPQTSGSVLTEQGAGTSHTIIVSGLTPGQTYYYSIESADLSQNVSVTLPASFVTP